MKRRRDSDMIGSSRSFCGQYNDRRGRRGSDRDDDYEDRMSDREGALRSSEREKAKYVREHHSDESRRRDVAEAYKRDGGKDESFCRMESRRYIERGEGRERERINVGRGRESGREQEEKMEKRTIEDDDDKRNGLFVENREMKDSSRNRKRRSRSLENIENKEEERKEKLRKKDELTKDKKMGIKALRKRRQNILEEHFGYSNENNPFGDSTLSEPFVWKKKNAVLKAAGQLKPLSAAGFVEDAERKVSEIEAVKKRREERELEEELLEQQREELAREKEQENYEEWAEKEEDFHRAQAVHKTQIRLEQGRERPVDLLVKATQIIAGEHFEDTSLLEQPPHVMLEGMVLAEIEETLEDVRLHVGSSTSDADGEFEEFWKSMVILCKDAIDRTKRKEEEERLRGPQLLSAATSAPRRDADSGIPACVYKEIELLLSSKSPVELSDLEKKVAEKSEKSREDVDPTYWEAIHSMLPFYKARAEVQRVYDLSRSLARDIKHRQQEEVRNEKSSSQLEGLMISEEEVELMKRKNMMNAVPVATRIPSDDNNYADGRYSPELEPFEEEDGSLPTRGDVGCSPQLRPFDEFQNLVVVDPLEERERLRSLKILLIERERQKRCRLLAETTLAAAGGEGGEIADEEPNTAANKTTTYDDFVRKETKMMATDEQIMSSSIEHDIQKHYDWEDKYRPRKPRFFNRVKTGYEWNKYNQTHYDHDNPPPKAVQGYKFNIFYPDLIDKTSPPVWSLDPSETDETVILRFHAGPPYEDVAFKIINREWCLERHRGYRNTFDRGILQLYFGFKRFRYRR